MSRPTVSVVVATRDRADLLRRTLAGIESQNYDGSIECVVVFDQAPVDLSLEATSHTASGAVRTVRVIANDHRAGLAGARNAGVDAATGEYIAFCDDDDIWLPPKIELQIAEMEVIGADTCVTGITIRYDGRTSTRIPAAADMSVETMLRRRVMEAHPSSVVVRRAAFLGPIGAVDEDIPGGYGEDYDWILRAAEHGPIAVVEQALVLVRWGSHSFFTRDWATIVTALDYLVAKHPGFEADPKALARIRGQQAFARAAQGDRKQARALAREATGLDASEKRSYVAMAATIPGVSAEWFLKAAHRAGRGI